MCPPGHPATIEIRLDDACGRDEVGVTGHRARHPVDVARLEGRDVAEAVAVELAEIDDPIAGQVQGRRRRPTEVADPVSLQRTGRCRGTGWLARDGLATPRRLAVESGPRAGGRGLVSGAERTCRIDAPGDRATGPRSRRPTTSGTGPVEFRAVDPRSRRVALRLAGERGVGLVDLGHPARRSARCG